MTKRKVLIIDDEKDICMLLSGMLSSMGYEAYHAQNLTDGYCKYESEQPPVVFIDLTLPDGSGFTLVPKIKAINPQVHIVIISAHDSDRERRAAYEWGASYFIGKPLNRKLVMEAVNAVEQCQAQLML